MKTIIAVIITIAVVLPASAIAGATRWSHQTHGVWCRDNSNSVACIPMTGTGYGVAISSDAVMVMNIKTEHVVFQRLQPYLPQARSTLVLCSQQQRPAHSRNSQAPGTTT
jgi:hypothetical protein